MRTDVLLFSHKTHVKPASGHLTHREVERQYILGDLYLWSLRRWLFAKNLECGGRAKRRHRFGFPDLRSVGAHCIGNSYFCMANASHRYQSVALTSGSASAGSAGSESAAAASLCRRTPKAIATGQIFLQRWGFVRPREALHGNQARGYLAGDGGAKRRYAARRRRRPLTISPPTPSNAMAAGSGTRVISSITVPGPESNCSSCTKSGAKVALTKLPLSHWVQAPKLTPSNLRMLWV